MSAVPANKVTDVDGLLSADAALGLLATYANGLRTVVRGKMVRGVRSVFDAVAVLSVLDAIADRDPSFKSLSESNAARVSEIIAAIRANYEIDFVTNDVEWSVSAVPASEEVEPSP